MAYLLREVFFFFFLVAVEFITGSWLYDTSKLLLGGDAGQAKGWGTFRVSAGKVQRAWDVARTSGQADGIPHQQVLGTDFTARYTHSGLAKQTHAVYRGCGPIPSTLSFSAVLWLQQPVQEVCTFFKGHLQTFPDAQLFQDSLFPKWVTTLAFGPFCQMYKLQMLA